MPTTSLGSKPSSPLTVGTQTLRLPTPGAVDLAAPYPWGPIHFGSLPLGHIGTCFICRLDIRHFQKFIQPTLKTSFIYNNFCSQSDYFSLENCLNLVKFTIRKGHLKQYDDGKVDESISKLVRMKFLKIERFSLYRLQKQYNDQQTLVKYFPLAKNILLNRFRKGGCPILLIGQLLTLQSVSLFAYKDVISDYI